MTLTPRYKSSGDILEVIHVDSKGVKRVLTTVSLSQLLGKWIHVRERMKYGFSGKYTLELSYTLTGAEIKTYTNNSIDLWRNGASYVRPKWGIYRSLTNSSRLKDEQVRFDTFCFAKGSTNCV